VVADDGWQMPPMRERPLRREHHIVMGGGSEAVGIRFLTARMPQLKEPDGHVAAKWIDIPRRERTILSWIDESRPGVLRLALKPSLQRIQFVQADYIHAIRAIDAILVEMSMIEKDAPEIIGEQNVGIEVEPPSVILESVESHIDRRAFVESTAVLAEKIGLYTDRAVLAGDLLSFFVLVRRDHDHRVEVRVIIGERHIEHVIETDAGGHGFDS